MKDAIDQKYIDPEQRRLLLDRTPQELAEANLSGMCNDFTIDSSANFLKAACEKLAPGSSQENNCYIVLGRDRQNSRCSGYSGLGDTQCGAVDIVVGRHTRATQSNQPVWTNPDFTNDAARIYVSQKTDIDKYLNIKGYPQSTALSGIGIKADDVRIVGRRTIKLVTATDPYDSRGPINGELQSIGGIHLVAGNQTTERTDEYPFGAVQPFVKGFNLNVLLGKMVDALIDQTKFLDRALEHIIESWEWAAQHEHYGFYFTKTTLSPELIKTLPNIMIKVIKEQKKEILEYQMALKDLKSNWGLPSFGPIGKISQEQYLNVIYEGRWPHLSKWNLTN